MRKQIWRTAVSCGLVFGLGIVDLNAAETLGDEAQDTQIAQAGRGRHDGGGQSGSRDRSGQQGGRRSGVHTPSFSGPRNSGGRGRQITVPNRTPTFSYPRLRSHNGSNHMSGRVFYSGNNHYQPSYLQHNSYHGYWNHNYRRNSAGNILGAIAYGLGSNNGYRPVGWGQGGWGLGSLNYSSGYLGYANPYYVNSGTTVYNYSQPIPVTYSTPTVFSDTETSSADTVLTDAVAAFRANDYDQALDISNQGITQYPDDAVLHEFRALVLFAKQDYQQSAATIHSVLAVGPGWDWTTMSRMYSDTGLYTDHLRALERFTAANPQDSASQFLLGYHYMTCGHPDAAVRHFQSVVSLVPDDRVAADLLRMIAPPAPQATEARSTLASSPRSLDQTAAVIAKPVDPGMLIGAWTSLRDDGSQFDLNLTDDARFKWSYTPKDQPAQEFGGTYTVEQNILTLEREGGGSLTAEITPDGSGSFNFRLPGTAGDDKGLEFTK